VYYIEMLTMLLPEININKNLRILNLNIFLDSFRRDLLNSHTKVILTDVSFQTNETFTL